MFRPNGLCLVVTAILAFASLTYAQSLPTVDLGYQIQRASSFNSSDQVYNFSNIRFAQPPLGELRWAPPVLPTGRNTTVNDGTSFGPICPQAAPAWSAIGILFLRSYILGTLDSFNYTLAAAEVAASNAVSVPDPRTNEDCLFLDVFTPKASFDAAQKASNSTDSGTAGLPVLVWLYGGGYTQGSKVSSGVPAGLINASQVNGSKGVIFVAMNYRLGAFGWLSGPTFSANGTQNVALYDQRLAIEWVQQHISKFGGDPKRITIIGESAGAGSIFHQITAFAGLKPVPFQQAILQSPAWLPVPSGWEQERTFQSFLSLLNVSTLEEARHLPSSALIAANRKQVAGAVYGNYLYGPTAGGHFAPELPGKLLLQGSFAKNVKIMVGHNTHEGVYFTDPRTATNDAVFGNSLRVNYPGIQYSVVQYILNTLYPPIYTTSLYTSSILRSIFVVTESVFSCNTYYLARAFSSLSQSLPSSKVYGYEFSVPPGVHGQDISYTFYNGATSSSGLPLYSSVARILQQLITSFAETGVPSSPLLNGTTFGTYGSGTPGQELDLNVTGIRMITDDLDNPRCKWWQKALYF